jgi:hypothetical protein
MTDNMFGSNPSEGQSTEQVPAAPVPNQEQPAVEPAVNPAQTADPNSLFADQLAAVKTDDGRQKYADVQTALSSIPHAQSHIKELTDKVKEMEEELAKRQGMDDVLQRLESNQQVVEQPSNTGLDETSAVQLVERMLQQKEQEKAALSNQQQVVSKLKEQYGDKAESIYNQKAAELGMTPAQLNQLALSAPKAALAYFDIKDTPVQNPTVPSSVNTATLQPNQQPEVDPMAIFNGSESDLVKKWRAVAKDD